MLTEISEGVMSKEKVIEGLNIVLADSYALFLKTQNYHWNVTGGHFRSLHLLFEEQYTDLFTANDEIAERIRTLGAKVPATFKIFDSVKNIQDGRADIDAQTMVQELADDQHVMISSLSSVLKAAQSVDDEVTAGFVADRMAVHQKAAWMLRSSL